MQVTFGQRYVGLPPSEFKDLGEVSVTPCFLLLCVSGAYKTVIDTLTLAVDYIWSESLSLGGRKATSLHCGALYDLPEDVTVDLNQQNKLGWVGCQLCMKVTSLYLTPAQESPLQFMPAETG